MNRSLKLSVLLALALGSTQAGALELGQIRVKSALGQPLVAEIPVTPESPGDLRNLSARMASDEDFARAGITEGRTSIPLTFTVVDGPGGGKLIRITSAEAVNDPYLDLLVQVDNASGKSVREYTILLDPPGMAATPPPSSAAASRAAHAPAPSRRTPVPSRSQAAAPAASPGDGNLGPVQHGQTLSSIAQQVKPEGTDLNQMLLALKQANPDAFYRDNINALKSGAVLRVPSADQARAMTIAAAAAEVRRQNSDWRAGTVGAPTNVADSATRAAASSSPTAPASDREDHLALLPSSGAKSAAAGGGKGSADVQRDLQRSQESLASLQQQSAELRSRLKDLEDINGKNERLLSLKDSEIAELQRKLAEAQKGTAAGKSDSGAAATTPPAAVPASPAGGKPSVPAAASTAAAKTAATTPTTTPAAASTAKAAMPPAPVAASKPTPAKPAAKKAGPAKKAVSHPAEEQPWYMQTWAWGAGAAAIVLLLLLALRGRRGKPSAKASGSSSLADRFGAAPALADGEGDPDQDELLDQLAEHPDDISLHLELVSLYYHRRDVEHFEAAAEAMYAHINDPQQSEWQDVAAMGEDLVPGHPLFAGVDTSVPETERAPLAGFNLDEPVGTAAPPPIPAGPSKISEYHFDFDLTPRHGAARTPAPQEAAAPVDHAVDDFALPAEAAQPMEPADEFAAADHELPSWDDAGLGGADFEPTEFSDDPIDTKLDLARAYLDMGDADGARAMLEEVLAEGSQMQRDTARRLLDGIA